MYKHRQLSLLFLLIGLLIPFPSLYAQNNSPVSAKQNSIVEGSARFTILGPRMIRMEYDSTARFVDNRSFVFTNRNLPMVHYTKNMQGEWMVITTELLELKYKVGSGKFNSDNLQIAFKKGAGHILWKPGDVNAGNLKGTFRTLDGMNGDTNADKNTPAAFENGLLSRDGWYLIDDSNNFLFDNSQWSWVTERGNPELDWYFMGYLSDYKSALYDFTKVAGKVPLPPRYAFGYWWSRYWNYSDEELRDLVGKFEKYNIPLDVLVIDMDWHTTDGLTFRREGQKIDEFGQSLGWTGYTWNRTLFPDPDHFLEWLKEKHIKTTLNLHPASGIAPTEEKYAAFATAMDFDTSQHRNIPIEVANKKFMSNLFNIVLDPLKSKGISFWWLDWQQWPYSKQVKGLSNTWWLNYCFFSQMEKQNEQRPLLYHRWGGLGNHRYQIGFSGDAIISWKMLDFEPYFTSTASNVLYDYWSHDLGGHGFGNVPESEKKLDPEMYTRWMQYGVFSPIFRTHSSKDPRLNKEVWNFTGDYFEALSDAIHLRYDLVPYIYTMARKTYDSGIALCRPMYYDYPGNEESYLFKNEYLFGDDLLIMPVTAPSVNDFSTIRVWLPGGNDWYEWSTGTTLKGGQTVERKFLLNEYPVYVKSGAIIPMYKDVKNLQQNRSELILKVFPGKSSETKLYEDAGDNTGYQKGAFTFTTITSDKKPGGSLIVTVLPREGSFPGMIHKRDIDVQLFGSVMPDAVFINDVKLIYDAAGKTGNTWRYTGNDLTVHIKIDNTDCVKKTTIHVQYPSQQVDINGMVGEMTRLKKAVAVLKSNWFDGSPLPGIVSSTNQVGIQIEYDPHNFDRYVQRFFANYKLLGDIIRDTHVDKDIIGKCENYLSGN